METDDSLKVQASVKGAHIKIRHGGGKIILSTGDAFVLWLALRMAIRAQFLDGRKVELLPKAHGDRALKVLDNPAKYDFDDSTSEILREVLVLVRGREKGDG